MPRMKPWLVLFPNAEMQMNRAAVLMTPISNFPHGQPSGIHHVPLGMPRHVPPDHAPHATTLLRGPGSPSRTKALPMTCTRTGEISWLHTLAGAVQFCP